MNSKMVYPGSINKLVQLQLFYDFVNSHYRYSKFISIALISERVCFSVQADQSDFSVLVHESHFPDLS